MGGLRPFALLTLMLSASVGCGGSRASRQITCGRQAMVLPQVFGPTEQLSGSPDACLSPSTENPQTPTSGDNARDRIQRLAEERPVVLYADQTTAVHQLCVALDLPHGAALAVHTSDGVRQVMLHSPDRSELPEDVRQQDVEFAAQEAERMLQGFVDSTADVSAASIEPPSDAPIEDLTPISLTQFQGRWEVRRGCIPIIDSCELPDAIPATSENYARFLSCARTLASMSSLRPEIFISTSAEDRVEGDHQLDALLMMVQAISESFGTPPLLTCLVGGG